MRPRNEMLTDAWAARRSYATLKNPSDMLVIRLAMDVTELLTALEKSEYLRKGQAGYIGGQRDEIRSLKAELAEKDAEIERLQMQYGFEKDARRMAELEIDSLKAAAEAFSRKIAGLPD